MAKRFKLPKDVHSSDVFGELPKTSALEAIGLWAVAGSWALRHDTGGFVPHTAIDWWAPSVDAVNSLVDNDIFREEDEGFLIKDWSYQK